MNTFKLLLAATNLSQREASEFLRISPGQIDKLSRGSRCAASGILSELRGLYAVQREAADALIETIEAADADVIELGLSSDDHEARSLGWPCVGAHAGALAIVVAEVADKVFSIAPRGSTTATAKAADKIDAA